MACFAVPATAVAQNDGYSNVAGAVGGGSGTSGQAEVVASTSDDGGSLPFTGLELGLILGAGVALLGTGLLLRRARTDTA